MSLAYPMLSIPFPTIDPVLIEAGPIVIRWYALSYVAGILLGWWYLAILNKKEPKIFTQKAYDDIVLWVIAGILLGGRLGYVFFYNAEYYLANPAEIIAVWKGGMAFHGGLLGLILAAYLMAMRYKISFLGLMDMLACAAPIGLFLGRIANFINAELYGRITEVPWGVVFPGDPFARHPSQLYEALLEGLVLFIILFILAMYTDLRKRTGFLSGVFLVGYAVFRSFVELFREPDIQIGLFFNSMTMGQILCIPMFIVGVYLLLRSKLQTQAHVA